MNDITLVNHLNTLSSPQQQAGSQASGGSSFVDAIKEAVDKTNQEQLSADKAAQDLGAGKTSNIHQVMISMEKADISMRLMVQMRNKVMDAYNTIMNMQV
ncbi:MAG TPA: flagellar hook-basal body complex protein FliE [Desulfuromonadales bacterium]|nr:flagellar hook-basal body complex protein FliE [Desulfuromonadales bacterium]